MNNYRVLSGVGGILLVLAGISWMCLRVSTSLVTILPYAPASTSLPRSSCGTPACVALRDAVDASQHSIEFAVYGLRNQPDILNALLRAKNRGVSIYGVTDREPDGTAYYSDTDLLASAIGAVHDDRASGSGRSESDDETGGDIMHDKFFVIDDETVWTGSANISDSCTGGYNANVSVLLRSKDVAAWYKDEVVEMYAGRFHKDKKIHTETDRLRTTIGAMDVEAYFSPKGNAVERAVIPFIAEAKRELRISMFYLTHRGIAAALIDAKKRGVVIRVLLDASSAATSYSRHKDLRAAGIAVKVEDWGGKMHAKAASSDGTNVLLGSMNWTNAGNTGNDENTLVFHNASQLAAVFDRWFDHDVWATISDRWTTARPWPEGNLSQGSCADGMDNDYDGKPDREDSDCQLESKGFTVDSASRNKPP